MPSPISPGEAFASKYKPGHNVQLSSRDLHLQVESCRLAPWFVGPLRGIGSSTLPLSISSCLHPYLYIPRPSSSPASLLIPAYSLWSHNTFPCYTTSCLVVRFSVVLHLQHFKHYTGFTSCAVKLVWVIGSILYIYFICWPMTNSSVRKMCIIYFFYSTKYSRVKVEYFLLYLSGL